MKIGIIIPSLDLNQLAFETISEINKSIIKGSKNDYTIFYQELTSSCIEPLCATMSMNEAHTHNGILVATNLDSAEFLTKTTNKSKKIFYIWDLEFIRNKANFLHKMKVYRNPKLTLISRSREYNRALESFCNRKAEIIQSKLNLEELENVK